MCRVLWFGKDKKLSPHFIRPFEVLECVGEVAYCLSLPVHLSRVHTVFHVSIHRKYEPAKGHVLKWPKLQQDETASYKEQLFKS